MPYRHQVVDFCLPDDVYEQITADEWLGRAGASEATIATAEIRLGVAIPPDYRAFLSESNGWWGCMMFPNGLAELISIESVQWCRDVFSNLMSLLR